MTRIVAGLSDGRRDADLVVEHLVQEFGVPRRRIQVHAMDAASAEEGRSPRDDDREAALPDLGLPEEAVRAYDEGMRRGGVLVAAWVGDDHAERAAAAYREYGAADLKACEAETTAAEGAALERRIRVRAYLRLGAGGASRGP